LRVYPRNYPILGLATLCELRVIYIVVENGRESYREIYLGVSSIVYLPCGVIASSRSNPSELIDLESQRWTENELLLIMSKPLQSVPRQQV
jgi:hypothetical protein